MKKNPQENPKLLKLLEGMELLDKLLRQGLAYCFYSRQFVSICALSNISNILFDKEYYSDQIVYVGNINEDYGDFSNSRGTRKMQTKVQPSAYEQTLLRIMRRLPPERLLELVDFARFLEFQTIKKNEREGDEEATKTEESRTVSDEQWEQLLAKPEAKQVMRDMAGEALEDYRTGRTTDITVTEDERLAPV